MTSTDPLRLWQAWRAHSDERAFATLVGPEIRYAADLARRAGATSDEADDVVQDVLLKLASESSDDPVTVGVRAWLCRRVTLGLKMHIRSSARRRRHEGRAPPPRPPAGGGRSGERQDAVDVALAELDESDRQAVVLRFLHDLDYGEMADVLGISQGACRLRVHRALKRLRGRLGDRAATMVALMALPPVAGESALLGAATGTEAAGGVVAAAGLGAKGLVAAGVGIVAAAAVVLSVATGREERAVAPPQAPPPVVARAPVAEPPPPVAPPPAITPAAQPAPALALLDAHLDGTADATETLWRFDEIQRLIGKPGARQVTVEATEAVTSLRLDDLARDHDRIQLEAGVYEVVSTLNVRRRRAVVEIAGAGRGRTFLHVPMRDAVHVASEGRLEGLVVRDLTYDGDFPTKKTGGDLLNVRGRAVALFERVDFRRCLLGGYGAPVGSVGRLLVAFRDCLFVGSYRRGSLKQAALAVRGPMLYLFDRCRFTDLESVLGHMSRDRKAMSPRSAGHFLGCLFENSPLASWYWADGHPGPWYPIRLRDGAVLHGWTGRSERGDPEAAETRRRRSWVAHAAELIEDVAFADAPVHGTAVPLRRVLEAYDPPSGRRVIAVKLYTWAGCEDPVYGLHLEALRGEPSVELFHLREHGLEPVSALDFDVLPVLLSQPGQGAMLRELVKEAWERIDETRPVGALTLHSDTAGRAVLLMLDRRGRPVGP